MQSRFEGLDELIFSKKVHFYRNVYDIELTKFCLSVKILIKYIYNFKKLEIIEINNIINLHPSLDYYILFNKPINLLDYNKNLNIFNRRLES